MKHYNVHSDDSVDEDEVNCHGNSDDYDSKTTIKEAQKKMVFLGIFPKPLDPNLNVTDNGHQNFT